MPSLVASCGYDKQSDVSRISMIGDSQGQGESREREDEVSVGGGQQTGEGEGRCDSEWLSRRVVGEEEGEGVESTSRLGDYPLLLDCRSLTDYTSSHIRGARHLALPSLILKRLQRGNLSVRSLLQQQTDTHLLADDTNNNRPIVLYDDSDVTLDSQSLQLQCNDVILRPMTSSAVDVVLQKLREESFDARRLQEGFSIFHHLHPHLCTQSDDVSEVSGGGDNGVTSEGVGGLPITPVTGMTGGGRKSSVVIGLKNLVISPDPASAQSQARIVKDSMTSLPVQVLPYLYLGNAANSADLNCLRQYGVSYIVNVTRNVPNLFVDDDSFRYLQIPVDDHWSQNLASHFQQAADFIDEARQRQRGVLVHCLAGLSRSVTVTVAYIMRSLGLTLNESFDMVRRAKPNISPNLNFMGQLLELEKSLNLQPQPEEGHELELTLAVPEVKDEGVDMSTTPSAASLSTSPSTKSPSTSPAANFVFQ